LFAGNNWGADKGFFTPDSDLIKKIDKEINYQYCLAEDKFSEKYWGHFMHEARTDSIKPILSSEERKIINEISVSSCLNWQRNFPYYDKQYIGYISGTGDKVIYIKLIDFRQDPNKLQKFLFTSWIDGWHGWFYSNIRELYFNVSQNRLTISEKY